MEMEEIMMHEKLISIKTALLAKQKGFNWSVLNHFEESLLKQGKYTSVSNISTGFANYNQASYTCNQPTQALLQKWLRQKHKLYVNIEGVVTIQNHHNFYYTITYGELYEELLEVLPADPKIRINLGGGPYHTYEKTLEIGLQNALRIIQ